MIRQSIQQQQRNHHRPRRGVVLIATVLGAVTVGTAWFRDVSAQPVPAVLPVGASRLVIVVESVKGQVRYARGGQYRAMTTRSLLTQGDRVVGSVGSICKLEFQHPQSRAVLSAAILRGYTEMTIAQAYQQGQQSSTLLNMPQGVIRAGVVRTAVFPTFRVATPRSVVGVRGTEIHELEASNDRGDVLRMGVAGSASVHDVIPLFRSAQAGQSTRKRTEPDRRGGKLLRAIESAVLNHRVILSGRHRRALETDYARRSGFDAFLFNPGGYYRDEGNPNRGRYLNSRRPTGQITGGMNPNPRPSP